MWFGHEFGLVESEPLYYAPLQVLPPVTPVIHRDTREEITRRLASRHYDVKDFVDYSEEGDSAFFFLRAEMSDARSRRYDAHRIAPNCSLESPRHSNERVVVLDKIDYCNLHIVPNCSGNVNNLVMVATDRDQMNRMSLTYSLVGRQFRKLARIAEEQPQILNRMFPRSYVSSLEDFQNIWRDIRDLLNRPISEDLTQVVRDAVDQERVYTYGQAIYVLARKHYMRTGRSKPIRLFIMALCVLVRCDRVLFSAYLHHLYCWFRVDVCNSCHERILFMGRTPTFEYTLVNFEDGDERDLILVSDTTLTYSILDCNPEEVAPYPRGWVTYEHSVLQITSLRSEIVFLAGSRTSGRIEIRMSVHRAMSMVRAIDGIVRGVRARSRGLGHGFFCHWCVGQRLCMNNYYELKVMISDMVAIGNQFPILMQLAKNVILCLMHCIIPDFCTPHKETPSDLFAWVLRRLMSSRDAYTEHLLSPLLTRSNDILAMQEYMESLHFEWYYVA